MNPLLSNLPSILGFIALTLSVFTLIREVICWYFKINERVAQNNEIIKQLKRSNDYLSQRR